MKKFLKILGFCLFGVVVIAGLLVVQAFYRFDVRLYSLNRHIIEGSNRWGTMVPLIPGDFDKGEDIEKVRRKLKRAGFKELDANAVWGRYKSRTGENKHVFIREANMAVCNVELYTFIVTDEHASLIDAEGTQNERGCL